MTTHTRIEALAAAAIDFSLTPAERAEVDDHLASCPACRAVATGYRADAARLHQMAFVEPPARVRSAVLAAASLPRRRSTGTWKLLLAAALLLAAVLAAAVAIGAFDRRPSIVVVPPNQTERPSATLAAEPSAIASIEPAAYTPPVPVCPAPESAVPVPDVTVSVGSGAGQRASVWGSTINTCTTGETQDGVAFVPPSVLAAAAGDRFALTAESGWSWLFARAIDRATTTSATVRDAIEPPAGTTRIELPVTAGPGESIVGFDVWLIRDDRRVVAAASIGVRVRVSGSIPSASAAPGTTAPVLRLPAGTIRTLPTAQILWSATADGPRGFELVRAPEARTGGTIVMRDVTTGAATQLATLDDAHTLARMAASGDRLVWVETWRDHPSPPTQDVPGCVDTGKPLRWQIRSVRVSTGDRSTLASGTNLRSPYGGECGDVVAPEVAIDGDRLAYAVEATTAKRPLSDKVIELDLGTGSEIRSLQTDGVVEDLRISGETIAFRENSELDGGVLAQGTGRLMVLHTNRASADIVEDGVGAIALGGGRLAWVRDRGVGGSVWTSNLDVTDATEIAPPAEAGITLTSTERLAVSDGLVAWSVGATIDDYSGGPNGCCVSMLAVWAPGVPSARFIEGYGSPDAVTIGSGWLVWHSNRDSLPWHDDGAAPYGFTGIRLEDLAAPWP